MDWSEMRKRLHAVEGLGGDANKARRKEWIANALGYRDQPVSLFHAFACADHEQLAHVERLLGQLEAVTAKAQLAMWAARGRELGTVRI